MKEANVLKSNALLDRCWHGQNAVLAFSERQLLDARLVNGLVMVNAGVEQHVSVPPSLLSSELHSLQVVVVNFSHVIATKALRFQFFILVHLAFCDFSVVILVPLLIALLVSKRNSHLNSLRLDDEHATHL